ncbi:MAG: proline dehydrogenase [Flavobacteriales bacterium]|nr:proline dehydrogenase [Flavobacteriales bacterium]
MSIFNNLKVAFKDKSNFELNRSLLIFSIISNPIISKSLITLTKTFIKLRIPISFFIKHTIFKQFCGGTNINNARTTIDKLWKSKIGSILDYSVEGKDKEVDFKRVKNETINNIIKASKSSKIPFAVFKPTGLTKFSLLEKINSNQNLKSNEIIEKQKFINRIEEICKTSYNYKTPVFIDAEESWIQNGIDMIVLSMMKKYNKREVYIYNTLQMYRTDRLNYLNDIISIAKKEKFLLGIKLVRGAYHQQEIDRAIKFKYDIPVFETKNKSDESFNKSLKICCDNINHISICAGTHNEYSSQLLIDLMNKNNIDKNDPRIYFSQLLGMCDHISYNIAEHGFNTAKYVPYGPIMDVIPYLIRRAEENSSISGQMNRDLSNIIGEKKRRKFN